MGPMVGVPVRDWIGEGVAIYLEAILATPVVLWAALPFFQRGWTSLVTRHFNMWTLIMIGVGTAYLYSMIAAFLPFLFPDALKGASGHMPVHRKIALEQTYLPMLAAAGLDMVLCNVFHKATIQTAKMCDALVGDKVFAWEGEMIDGRGRQENGEP